MVQEVEKLPESLTRSEKAQLLPWIVRELGEAFLSIESRPGVGGGDPCIVRTRIPVWTLLQSRRLGLSEADLLNAYPTLRAEDRVNPWGCYRAHRREIEQQIQENEDA